MTNWILRLLERRHGDLRTGAARTACGKAAGLIGIGCNLLLFAAKLVIGLLSGSVSITADAVNNLTDASGSVLTLLGFRLAEKPADEDHPFGHARIEYLTGLGVAALILVIGVELGKSSIEKIIHPRAVLFSVPLVAVLLLSIAVKLWMSVFNHKLGTRIDSSALRAAASDSRNDVLSTAAVLAACIVGRLTGWHLDGPMGLAVALFIIWSGVGVARETISPLLGEGADPALVRTLVDDVCSHELVLGVHDVMVHDYGPGRKFATLHVEMDSREDPLRCHDLIDNIEREILARYGIHLTIHYDPLEMNDDETVQMRQRVGEMILDIDPRLRMHDFRMVRGADHTNLIFDLVVPPDLDRAALRKSVAKASEALPGRCYCVVTFDSLAFNPQ